MTKFASLLMRSTQQSTRQTPPSCREVKTQRMHSVQRCAASPKSSHEKATKSAFPINLQWPHTAKMMKPPWSLMTPGRMAIISARPTEKNWASRLYASHQSESAYQMTAQVVASTSPSCLSRSCNSRQLRQIRLRNSPLR